MNFNDENDWLSQITHKAEDHAEPEYYNMLIQEINNRKTTWNDINDNGELESADLVKLIKRAYSLITYIEERKEKCLKESYY